MDKRFLLFLLIAFAALTLNTFVVNWLRPPKPPQPAADQLAQGDKPDGAGDGQDAEKNPAEAVADPGPPPEEEPDPPAEASPAEETREEWLALGSAAADSPYKMLVVLSNVGACVDQVELNDGTHDLEKEDHSGYLGPLAPTAVAGGLRINVVGPGTPAAAAGLQVGDILTAFEGEPLATERGLEEALAKTKTGDEVALAFTRDGNQQQARATLQLRPLKVLRRELTQDTPDQPSFLMTMRQIGERTLQSDETELKNISMRQGRWQVRDKTADSVTFVMPLPASGLEVSKHFRLAAADNSSDAGTQLYHLDLTVKIRNTRAKAIDVAYQIDGPTGLPIEGWWYANKQSRTWSGVGVRDVAVYVDEPLLLSCTSIADKPDSLNVTDKLRYVGVDAQYFAAVMLPQVPEGEAAWVKDGRTILAGPVPKDKALKKLTNVSFRLASGARSLEGKDDSQSHTYRVFIGPKKPAVLAPYKLDDLVWYGWFSPVSRVLLGVLHFFFGIIGNYGVAIIMLTVMVRGAMFPLSRKQALMAQKMQEIQPELKKLNEKYKTEPEKRQKATMELFRKHKHNPYSGCLPMFIQLPIFIGLYRALMVDVELRQAPLIPGMEWCSNLAAPDMLHKWDTWQPFLTGYNSMLGPYFNLLPLFTVGLFLWQQKMFMPPPTDEQSAMQQKMMKYMMIFISFMFFKVPSGLCVYFIASSLWGIAERKLLPKPTPAAGAAQPVIVASSNGSNGSTSGGTRRKKQKGK